ncbi:MAG: flagellar hook-associated protein FlgK, partial [Armatimonadota bacterium]|nr:flagellar hook-associated protein FlgK [Armatimonadota bacterium]
MSFFGLQVALTGLRAQQQAMNVTAHNIANASTEGFHRQEAALVPGAYISGGFAMVGVGNPQLGTGVMVQRIKRVQSDYIDQQVRNAQNRLGSWDYRKEELAQIESILAEPGDLGLATTMDRFWNAWEELSASPESQSARISVVESGIALSERMRTLYQNLREMQSRADQDIVDNVAQVNRLAYEIANLNDQIKRSVANGFEPNDVLDRRDLLLDQLSRIAGVQISGASGGDLIVAISGRPLVQAGHVNEIGVTQDLSGWSQVVWTSDDSSVRVTGGQLLGQLLLLPSDYVPSIAEGKCPLNVCQAILVAPILDPFPARRAVPFAVRAVA